MAKISKPEIKCLFCEKTDCPCHTPPQTVEALIKRLDAEIQRRLTRLKYPNIWKRETVIAEGKELRKRRNELDGIHSGQT
jgi:hypothetical protein